MDYVHLANTYQTPLYVYDLHSISNAFFEIKDAFKARKSLICYALKANGNISILHHLATLGSGADCVSIGEVKRALIAGIPKYKIIFSGVGKSDDEILEAIKEDILFINVESEAELSRVHTLAKSINKTARISVRVNPNIDAKTHPYISTGLHDNKFGVDVNQAKAMYIFAKNAPFLAPVGIHFHIGSQLTDLEPIKQSAQKIAELTHSLLALKVNIHFFDIGGGIGIRYNDENPIKPYDYAQAILSALYGLDVTIICEPGRFIVGHSGVLLTRVLYEKHNGAKRFVIVDAAMNDLIRPALYNATHTLKFFRNNANSADSIAQDAQTSLCDVVGPICESSDFLAKNVQLPPLNAGDILAIENVGAYGFSMSSNYNTRTRAAEVAIMGDCMRLIRARESFDELIANEKSLLEDFKRHNIESHANTQKDS